MAVVSAEDTEFLRASARTALRELSPSGDARRLMATADGWEPAVWKRLAGELGAPGLIDGTKNYVVDGATAGLILAVAAASAGPAVFAVDAAAPGLQREPLVTLDQTRKQARLCFSQTPATPVGPPGAADLISHASEVSRALLAAEQTGGAQRCLDMTAEYTKTRIQFGRPIGSFQAVKQRVAEMLIEVESARSAAYAAAQAAAGGGDDLSRAARIAGITCTDAYNWVSAQTIQLHGGIGFTWEHDAHLYFKRARSSGQLLGTPGDHVAALAQQLDAEAG